jgi:hypothetical protein
MISSAGGRARSRRLFTTPTGWDDQHAIIGSDRTCREPYCGAPIRHYDGIELLATHWGRSSTAEALSFPVKLPVQP